MSGVLVTGATAPIGLELVEALTGDPRYTPVLAVAADEEPRELPGFGTKKVVYERADLTRPRDVQRLLFGTARRLGIGTVVHTALHRSAVEQGRRVRALNVESTRELLYQAERHPTIRRFIFRSHSAVYRIDPWLPSLIGEEHPLDLSPEAPEWVRDRVEADLTVCTRMGLSPLEIAVLRCSEVLAPNSGSQLLDYLSSRVCLRPLGFNPMLNLLTIEDAVRVLELALHANAVGVFNVPGADTLPLSEVIAKWGRRGLALPGPFLAPLYRLRAGALGMEFRYDMNYRRFHFSSVLDGSRARAVLGYVPGCSVHWPVGAGRTRASPTRRRPSANAAPPSGKAW